MNAPLELKVGVRLVPAMLHDFIVVAARMREDEREQWQAFRNLGHYSADECARDMLSHGPFAYALVDENGAFFVGGFTNQRPNVWTCWAAGTSEGWGRHWHAITRVCRRHMAILFANGAHRVDIISLASRPRAGDWYTRFLGMQPEGTLHRYAGNGEDAICYAKVKEIAP